MAELWGWLGRRYAHRNGRIPVFLLLFAPMSFWADYQEEIYETYQFEEL